MNVVEALVVTLGLDNAQFEARLKQSVKSLQGFAGKESEIDKQRGKEKSEQDRKLSEQESKQAKLREQQLKSAAEGYTKVRNAIFGMVAATLSMASVKSFVTGSVDGLIAMKRASTNLGMSIKEVDAWGRAVASVGGNKDAILQTMQNIRGGIEAFQTGLDPNSQTVKALASMGVQWQNADGSIRKPGDMLPEIATALQKFDSQKQLILADQLGMDADTLELLRMGGPAVQELYAKLLKLSRATEEGAEKALEFEAKWAEIKGNFESTGQTLFMALVPALERLNELLLMFANWVSANSEQIGGFFSGVADVMTGIVGIFSELHAKTDGWSTKIMAAAAALLALKGVIGGILGMTGLPMLMKLLGGGAAATAAGGGAGLGLVGKLGVAGVASWLGLKAAKAAGLPDVDKAKGVEAVRSGQWWKASTLLSAGDFAGAMKDRLLGRSNAEIAEKLQSQLVADERSSKESNSTLKKIEAGITKMNDAFSAGAAGQSNPAGGGIAGAIGYGAGRIAGVAKTAAGKAREAALMAAARAAGITDPVELSHFMSQMAHESDGFKTLREYASGAAYEGRKDLGNTQAGDGRRFRGRGFVQLTGRSNYAAFSRASGIDVLNNPELLEREDVAAKAAIWYWQERVRERWKNGVRAATRAINGGYNGLSDRQRYFDQYSAMLSMPVTQGASQSNSRTEVQINGGINIHTAATDASGIAREIRPAVNRHMSGLHASTAT